MIWILASLGGALVAGIAVFVYSRRIMHRILSQNAIDLQNHQAEIQAHNQKISEFQQNLAQEQTRGAMLEERASRVPTLEVHISRITQERHWIMNAARLRKKLPSLKKRKIASARLLRLYQRMRYLQIINPFWI